MNSSYSRLTIETIDHKFIDHYRESLIWKFELITNYCYDNPTQLQIPLNITFDHLHEALRYTDSLIPPRTDQAWILLLEASDYLILSRRFTAILDLFLDGYLETKGISRQGTFIEIAQKIKIISSS